MFIFYLPTGSNRLLPVNPPPLASSSTMGLFQNCAVVVAAVCVAVQWYQRRRHRSIKDIQGPPSTWLLGQSLIASG